MEVVNLEDIGAGSDRTAGSPENWEVLPAAAQGEEEEAAPAADAPARGDVFRVKLDAFEGPLELLLHLVREHKLDINDIPIAFITEQYLGYIEMMRKLNINIASDYLVMASWLIYIKSRTLLPQAGEAEEEDPEILRQELQRQLLEYQRFKRLSQTFRQAEEEQSWVYVRGGNGDGIMLDPAGAEEPRLQVTVFDLVSAIQHLIESIGEEGVHLVEIDEMEMADRQTFLLDMLDKAGAEGVVFQKLFEGARVLAVVVTFLALLELIRKNLVVARQSANFAEIRIAKAVKDE
ncbi:MAG: segregation/condensation protein A [Candidatus Tectomicrobia bacterium]|nr:segregation/condensation protein A [Candidatus Tectomicrobia bacterium]